jgi:RNA polymerase sigma-70 factor, ECF subfamily
MSAAAPGFDEFYLGTRDRLLGQLTVMTTDRELARDVLQEAYTRAWQRWTRVSSLDDPAGWVRTVAWRLAVSQYRRRMLASKLLGRLVSAPARPDRVEEDLDVLAALRTLPDANRRALVLHDLCGLTVEQVAEETGVAPGTVKSRLSRGRAALRPLLTTAEPLPGEELTLTDLATQEEGR